MTDACLDRRTVVRILEARRAWVEERKEESEDQWVRSSYWLLLRYVVPLAGDGTANRYEKVYIRSMGPGEDVRGCDL